MFVILGGCLASFDFDAYERLQLCNGDAREKVIQGRRREETQFLEGFGVIFLQYPFF